MSRLAQRDNDLFSCYHTSKRKSLAVSRDRKKRKPLAVSRDQKRWRGMGDHISPQFAIGGRKMENLRIYRIEDRYIRFLRSRDCRVQDNKNRRRPYVGVVLHVGGFQYFVPMESPKPNHANIKPGKHILKLEGGSLGLLGFNNMVPVHSSALICFDIESEPDQQYRMLLKRQLSFCNKMKCDIYDHAEKTYFSVVNQKSAFLCRISCDFKKLERACNEYRPRSK